MGKVREAKLGKGRFHLTEVFCTWTENVYYDQYNTECKKAFGPRDGADFTYCPYCSKRIQIRERTD